MIVYKDTKAFVQVVHKPNKNFADDNKKDNVFVVDDESELANKIVSLFPNFDFVVDDSGNLVDVISNVPSIENSVEESTSLENMTDYLLDVDYRLTLVELNLNK
ncbi:hypothetical protein [Cytobacillus praedii]|uniref:hypothetical protein n=1 Tax=Cytobacillus praedii TaxID=1742358 RepID=UPI002E1B75C2|nr:hypothetical protein [Cytobacillus praedii]